MFSETVHTLHKILLTTQGSEVAVDVALAKKTAADETGALAATLDEAATELATELAAELHGTISTQ